MSRINQFDRRDDGSCQWRRGLAHCGSTATRRFEDSGLGYCSQHYEMVVSLRDWIFWATKDGPMKKIAKLALMAAMLLFAVFPASAAGKLSAVVQTNPPSVTLAWTQSTIPAGSTCPSGTGSTAITGNNVYRSTQSGGEGTTPYAKIATPATTFTDTAVTLGGSYFYKVTGVNCVGESAQSAEASAVIPNPVAPNAPTGLNATTVAIATGPKTSFNAILLQWEPVATNTAGQAISPVYYQVMRGAYVPGQTEPTGEVDPSPIDGTMYLDSTGKAGAKYMYWVEAYAPGLNTGAGYSKWSNGVAVVMP
jgi:hypothetical protein